MHIIRNATPIRHNEGVLAPGEWLVQDQNAFELALMAERGTVSIAKWRPKNTIERQSGDGTLSMPAIPELAKSILLIRSGAIGDLLLLSPCIAPLRNKYPKAAIYISCFPKHWPIIMDFGHLHAVYPYPNGGELNNFDLIIPLENVIELATEKGVHATDAFAEALGVSATDYRPVYKVTDAEWARAVAQFDIQEGGPKRVAIHLHSSASIRNYPMAQWNAVLQILVERGWEIMLLGNNAKMAGAPKQIKDCSALTFREAAAVLATCDVFCGVDSSFFNLCPALGVPAIGLFGPVDWRTRVKEGSGQRALVGTGCEPCGWFSSKVGAKFPPLGPCAKEQQCVPLSTIDPKRIAAKIEEAAKK